MVKSRQSRKSKDQSRKSRQSRKSKDQSQKPRPTWVKTYRVIDGDPSTLTHDSTPALDGQPDLDWRTLLPNPDPKIRSHTYRGVRIPASTFWKVALAYWETDGNSDVNARWIKDKSSKRVIGMGSAYVSFRLAQKHGNGVLDYFQAGFAAYGLGPTVDPGGPKRSPALRVVGRRKVLRLLGFAFAHACDDYEFGQPQICNTKFRDLHLLLWLCTYDYKATDDTVALDVIHGMRKVTRHDPDHDRRKVLKHGIDRPKAEARLGLPPGSSVGAADHITRIADDAYAQRLIRLTSVIAAGDAAYFGSSVVDGGIGGDGGVSPRLCKQGNEENGTFRVRTCFNFGMELTGLPTLIAMTVALGLPPRVARIDGVGAYVVVAELTQARPERFASSTIPGTVDLQPLGINTKRVNQLTLARIGFDLGTTRDKAGLHAWTDNLYDHLEFHGDDVRRKLTRAQQHERIDSWIDHGIDVTGSDEGVDET